MGKSGGRKKKTTTTTTTTTPTPTPSSNANANPNPTFSDHSKPPPPATATPPHPNGGVDVDPSVFLKRAHDLKEEGNLLFQAKDYSAALHRYDLALNLLPRSHPDRAVFHSNRAACLMLMRPVDHEAVAAECSLALQSQPRFPRALLRRARALEALRRHDLALQDVQSLLALDPSNRDALDLAHRLRSSLSPSPHHHQHQDLPSRPSPAALGASAVRGAPIAGLGPCLPARPKKPSSPPPKLEKPSIPPQNQPAILSPLANGISKALSKPIEAKTPLVVSERGNSSSVAVAVIRWRPLKLVYDHDIRLAQMPVNCGFRTLREIVAKRFPSSKSVLMKYRDSDGDLVTVTSTVELRLAELSVDKERKERDEGDKDKNEMLPVLRLHIVEVSPEQEPAVPEEEEEKQVEEEGLVKGDESVSHSSMGDEPTLQGLENDIMKAGLEEEVSKEKDGKKECGHAECKEVEIDDWLFEFAQLFRQQVGIDPDAHLDLHELGMELCTEALEETVTSEDAQGLFEMAAAKFQEVVALAFFNWGNVHMCTARKRIPLDESSPKDIVTVKLRDAYDWVRERYELAGEKYEEALRIKPDFYEGLLALGQQHFETAKLHWSFALANKIDLKDWDSSTTIKLFDSAEEKMKAATEMWEKVEQQRTNELKDPSISKKDELLKKRKKQVQGVDGQGELSAEEAAEQAAVMRSQIHLFWGNMLFERSQVEFKLNFGNWKKNLDAAVERFKLAGASEVDISVVIKNHASNGTSVEGDEKKAATISELNISDEKEHVLQIKVE